MKLDWILEEYDGIVAVSDMDTYELLYLNRAGYELYHIKQDELLEHRKCYEVLQGNDSPCSFCTNKMLSEVGFHEWEFYNPILKKTLLLKDRKMFWEGRNARIEFATDVTEYHEKIKRGQMERDSVLKSLPGGIARIDARDFRTVLWHGANFLTMIGYTMEQFEREPPNLCTYVHPADLGKITDIMKSLKENGKVVITEMRVVRRDGEIRTFTTSFSYEDGANSEDGVHSYYSVCIDITEMKAQQELQQKALEEACRAAKMSDTAKTEFLSSMSHDIRTPMNAILGMTAIAEANVENPDKMRDCLDKIKVSGKYLLSLINEVLDMSKIESGKIELCEEKFNLMELVDQILQMCHKPLVEEKHHAFGLNVDRLRHRYVMGDENRLQQVLTNFLTNAVKYTPECGIIRLTIKESACRQSEFRQYQFIFEDNGIGMNKEFLKRIFEPFTRAEDLRVSKIQGTGLGMTISENIIHMMNGTVHAESELGTGSRFTVTIPLKLAEAPNKDEMEEVSVCGNRVLVTGWDFSGIHILLVEDNELNLEIARELLMMKGAAVDTAEDGKQAVERFEASEPGYYTVILMDVQMPVMNGYEAAAKIRELGRDDADKVAILALTANAFSEDIMRAKRSGMNDYIAKPIDADKMYGIITKWIK